jgi:hypothetical protein
MTRLYTRNSIYEVDEDARRIRRICGANPPAGGMPADGVWRFYSWNSPLRAGVCVVIQWKDEVSGLRTSTVQHVQGDYA